MNLFLEKNIILQGLSGPFNWGYISCNPNFTYSSFSQVPKSQPPPPSPRDANATRRPHQASSSHCDRHRCRLPVVAVCRPSVPPPLASIARVPPARARGRPQDPRRGRGRGRLSSLLLRPLSQECAPPRFLPPVSARPTAPPTSARPLSLPDTYTRRRRPPAANPSSSPRPQRATTLARARPQALAGGSPVIAARRATSINVFVKPLCLLS